MPTNISNPASFSSVRTAFNAEGYGISNSLFAYRQGGGIVPNTTPFNQIGAGTGGDPLRLSQFSGFTVPSLTLDIQNMVTRSSTSGNILDENYMIYYGFEAGNFGSISDGTFNVKAGRQITGLYTLFEYSSGSSYVYFKLGPGDLLTNDGWNTMTIENINSGLGGGTLERSLAGFSTNSGGTTWLWFNYDFFNGVNGDNYRITFT